MYRLQEPFLRVQGKHLRSCSSIHLLSGQRNKLPQFITVLNCTRLNARSALDGPVQSGIGIHDDTTC